MGATRESSCSAGILEAWFCGEDADACEEDDLYAKVSPGKRAVAQRIANRDRKVALCGFVFMSLLSAPERNSYRVLPTERSEYTRSHFARPFGPQSEHSQVAQ